MFVSQVFFFNRRVILGRFCGFSSYKDVFHGYSPTWISLVYVCPVRDDTVPAGSGIVAVCVLSGHGYLTRIASGLDSYTVTSRHR